MGFFTSTPVTAKKRVFFFLKLMLPFREEGRAFDASKPASGKREERFLNLTFEGPHPVQGTSPLKGWQGEGAQLVHVQAEKHHENLG